MMTTEEYVKRYLQRELWEVVNSGRNNDTPELTNPEKALIYKYSNDGYESLNEALRNGLPNHEHEYGSLLENALRKLNGYKGLVYRNVNLSVKSIESYKSMLEKNLHPIETTFVSSSRSQLVANAYEGNVLFKIYSKSGKNIERISKFGIYGVQNEREVLFAPYTGFTVLEIEEKMTQTQITMEEW